jgi:hypothetical protein
VKLQRDNAGDSLRKTRRSFSDPIV